jgi:hypothetical protein
MKEHCDQDEYKILSRSVASAMHSIYEEVIEKVLVRHPALRKEIDKSIEKFGVII